MSDEYYQWCWLYSQRHEAKSCSLYKAMEIFREDLYDMCIDHIASGDNEELWKNILFKLKKWAADSTEADIQRAKEYPIFKLAEELTGEQVRMNKIKAPGERTASLHLYEKTNTWYDFGRCKGGDVIDLIRLFTGLPFKEAVKRLI